MRSPTRATVRLLILLGSMALLLVAPVRAQQVATSFEELQALVKPGDTIYVTDTGGVTIKGKLAGLSASALELRVRRDASVPPLGLSERNVNHIVVERFDSLWNGTLIGLAVGAIPAVLIGLAEPRETYCGTSLCSRVPWGEIAGSGLGLGGIGAVIGVLVDLLNKEQVTIYVQPPGQRSANARVSPFLWKSGAGVHLSVGF